jgi:outer membrane protein TolC
MRTGTESLEMSSSQDRDRTVADLTLSWNILDFGLSYVRANQMADRQLMAGEKRRKVIHNITQEVRISYWRAVSADRILRRVDPLIARLDKAWKAARDNETTRLQDPVKALYYQRDLAEMQRRLQSLRKNLITARTELATLMNLRPNESFELPQVPEQEWEQSRIEPAMSLETMEQMALSHRPEVREQAYQNRVSAQEVKAQTLAMLPGIRLDLGNHHDSNSYLMESDWNSAGAAVSWNLFNIFRGPAMINVAEAQVEAEKVRAQALNVAVLAQVHIAMHQFRHARQEHDVESNYLQVQQRILKQTAGHVAAGRTGELEEIREALSMLVAEVQRDQAFIQLQSSLSRLQASIGLDPLPESVESHEIDVLAKALEDRFKGFSRHVVGQ